MTFIFQRTMMNLLVHLSFVLVYVDDIIIFSKNPYEHAEHINEVLTLLNDANLRIKESKCAFAQSTLRILGHVVSEQCVSVHQVKAQSPIEWPKLLTGKQVQRFLGLTNYFRNFIPS